MKNGNKHPITNIEKLRHKLGLNQVQAAKFLDCDYKTYRGYEKGYITKVSGSRLIEIQAKYAEMGINVSIDYLLGVSDFTSPQNDYIGKMTGLNDSAIKSLEKDLNQNYGVIDCINLLLSHSDSETVIKMLRDMWLYMLNNKRSFMSLDGKFNDDYIIFNTEYSDTNKPKIKGQGIGINANSLDGVFLQNISAYLAVLKSKL